MDTRREFVAGRNSLQQSSQCSTLRRIQPEAYRFVVGSRHLNAGAGGRVAEILLDSCTQSAVCIHQYS